ncbi:MAG TPA: PKD domain-containing protein [Vicinamibacterales bacterium]|nr:PKD domain-containing protein [Vicinamibacterales bacterium]
MTRTLKALALLGAIAAAAAAGCTVKKEEAPPLAGPSELGTALVLSATPDTLRQDGFSQSQIVVQALDGSGTPVKSPIAIRLDVAVNGTVVDFGQLSGKNLVTGSDGKATATYTAPPAPADMVDSNTIIQILATPVGSDANSSLSRSVSIRLVPPGVIKPPNGTPTASFTFSPSTPVVESEVTFDGSLSQDADGSIVSYAWNFGDGTKGTGVLTRHSYRAAGSYTVTLTVTDDRGLSASVSKSVSVTMTANPVAKFSISPSKPKINERVYFNAGLSTAASGRTIVRYAWDYGSGRQDSGQLVWHIYTQPGDYVVVLTVTDDAGNTGSTSQSVTVAQPDLTAAFSYSPASPAYGTTVYFSAADSTGSNPITSYSWNFGDGATATGLSPSHRFNCPGGPATVPFAVQLTVRDSTGASASVTKNVSVTGCGL